jgi:predicted RNA-binding Zn ribbon-like protein
MVSMMAAPGELELVRQFVNTLDVEEGTDVLPEWLAEHDPSPADVRNAFALREALRSAMLANHDRAEIPADSLDVMNAAAERAGLRVAFTPDRSWEPRPDPTGVDGALGNLLAIVTSAMAAGTWPRLKVCLNDLCRWSFYDHSNARSSKWCDMRICGNRAKQRAWRDRH